MSEDIRNQTKQLDIIGKIPYLKAYPFADRKALASISVFRTYSPGEKVIKEGELNLSLYFLIRGKVDIVVDNKKICSFRGGGRLFGEMSFVNHSLASASVIANTDVVMLALSIQAIMSLDENEHCRLQKNLFRSVGEILAQKLMATNELAKAYAVDACDSEDIDYA